MFSVSLAFGLALLWMVSIILGEMSFKSDPPPSGEPTNWQRFVGFVEQPLFLAPIGIVGGVVGVILYTPVCFICGACMLLALHRSRAVADKTISVQAFCYTFLFVVMTSALLAVGVLVKASSQTFTSDLARSVGEYLKPQLGKNAVVSPMPATPASAPQQPTPAPEPPRSYLVSGLPGGPLTFCREGPGDQNLRVGDVLAFNYHYHVLGPNPVKELITGQRLYLEPDATSQTQERILADFKFNVAMDSKKIKLKPHTLSPGLEAWNSVIAYTADKRVRYVTQKDLDELHAGTTIAFVVIDMAYLDNKKTHHFRVCEFLQPPAYAPGVWHDCEGFDSD